MLTSHPDSLMSIPLKLKDRVVALLKIRMIIVFSVFLAGSNIKLEDNGQSFPKIRIIGGIIWDLLVCTTQYRFIIKNLQTIRL